MDTVPLVRIVPAGGGSRPSVEVTCVRPEGDGGVVRKQGGGGELCERGEVTSVPVLMHIHDGWG